MMLHAPPRLLGANAGTRILTSSHMSCTIVINNDKVIKSSKDININIKCPSPTSMSSRRPTWPPGCMAPRSIWQTGLCVVLFFLYVMYVTTYNSKLGHFIFGVLFLCWKFDGCVWKLNKFGHNYLDKVQVWFCHQSVTLVVNLKSVLRSAIRLFVL